MNMNQTQGPTAFVPKAKLNKNSQKYEKKSPSNKAKKEKTTGEKKYSPKQKGTEAPAAEKAQEWAWKSSSLRLKSDKMGFWSKIELKNTVIFSEIWPK